MRHLFFLGLIGFWTFPLWGQTPAMDTLGTVYLIDNKLDEFSVGQTLTRLSDSVILHSSPSMTRLLEFHTPIYFKENGRGMVSSPSFRGTTASQTAVLWNGININSNFNGQTDFNTLNSGIYDNIRVRAGGGSVMYGSGAVGGTVHLNTRLRFEEAFDNRFHLGYGSFNTSDMRYRMRASTEKTSLQVSITHEDSDNDYEYAERGGKNRNGQFQNTALNAALGYKLNTHNQLNFYSEWYTGQRHFPIYYASEIRTKYKDLTMRNLLEWKSRFDAFTSTVKTAFLSERYDYFPNIENPESSFGEAKTFIGKYDLGYQLNNNLRLEALLSHQHTEGKGTDVEDDKRDISSVGFLFKQQLTQKFRYQVGMRKEITRSYQSPLLFSVGADYQFSDFYTAKLSGSKNFRRPTFNDLYWQNAGNKELKPEESHQIEVGNVLTYKNWELTLTGYFNDITQMIHWLPGASGLFTPRNEDHVQTYGVEALMMWKKTFGKQKIKLDGTYAYTISENKKTGKQLIYVPYHKVNLSAAYGYGRFSAHIELLYNGEVFLRSDNDPHYMLDGYMISNLGASYRLGNKTTYEIGTQVNNVFDKAYQNVQRYEMPGIYYNFYITLNL